MRFAKNVGRVFSPLDDELALQPGSLSPSLGEAVAHLGAWIPFAQASTALRQLAGARVAEATVRRETLAAGETLVALEDKAVTLLDKAPAPSAAAPWLQVSVDGAMVRLVGKDWAEVRLLVVGELHCEQGQLQARELSYFSRKIEHETFSRLATLETYRRGVASALGVVAVNDGADWIQDFLDAHCPEAVRILDWAHASAYVHAAGHAAFEQTCGPWCSTQLTTLREGEPIVVLAELARLADTLMENDAARETVNTSLAYLAKRYEQIDYASFRARGYPIGSGIVESGNKRVMQARLKGAGMHWAPENVDPLLGLRSAICSGRWESTWPKIAAQRCYAHGLRRAARHQKHVAARAAPPPPPAPTRPSYRRAWGDTFRLPGSPPPLRAKT